MDYEEKSHAFAVPPSGAVDDSLRSGRLCAKAGVAICALAYISFAAPQQRQGGGYKRRFYIFIYNMAGNIADNTHVYHSAFLYRGRYKRADHFVRQAAERRKARRFQQLRSGLCIPKKAFEPVRIACCSIPYADFADHRLWRFSHAYA